MQIINLKKSGCGRKCNGKPYKKICGSGNVLMKDVYEMASTPNIKPTDVLKNISIKKSIAPKRYITFE
jgi:hypothetical protein